MGATVQTPVARRVPRLGSVEWLALQSGLPARLQHDPALVHYATRTRRARRWIVIGGLIVVMISDLVADAHDGPVLGFPTSLIPAWFAARIIPDLVVRNRPIGALRVAGLSARSPMRYVVPTARRWLVGSFVLALVGVVLSRWSGQPLASDVRPIVASVLIAVCGSLAVVRIARRSQPAGSVDDVLVDDAIRTIGTTGVLSGWAALQYLVTFWLVPWPRSLSAGGWGWVTGTMSYACLIGILAAWAWVPTRAPRSSDRERAR